MNTFKKLTSLLVIFTFIATPLFANEAGEKVTFYHKDHLGSIVMATDENGAVEWTREYEAYGNPLSNSDKSVKGYTGHEYVAESGLNYMKARWYEPELGRFMSPDPVQHQPGNPTSFNRYAYANNSPYSYVDPDGEMAQFTASGLCGPAVLACAAGIGLVSYVLYSSAKKATDITYGNPVTDFDFHTSFNEEADASDESDVNVPHPADTNPDRKPKQDKPLSNGEIGDLIDAGEHPHDLKGEDPTKDLYKDKKGNVYIKPKRNSGVYGEPTGINLNDL